MYIKTLMAINLNILHTFSILKEFRRASSELSDINFIYG